MKTAAILGLIAIMIGTAAGGTAETAPQAPDTAVTSSVSSTAPAASTQEVSMHTDVASYPINVDEFKIILENHSGSIMQTGADYQIQRWNGTSWESLDLLFPVTMQMLIIPGNDTFEMTVRLWQDQYDYTPGQYRIAKNVWVNEHSADVFAEFTLA